MLLSGVHPSAQLCCREHTEGLVHVGSVRLLAKSGVATVAYEMFLSNSLNFVCGNFGNRCCVYFGLPFVSRLLRM
jgi:hypothetical protein